MNEMTQQEQKKVNRVNYFDEAREYFRMRQAELFRISLMRPGYDWLDHNRIILSCGWEYIKKLVLWSYEVSYVEDMPTDKVDEANRMAIDIINTVFNQYSKNWEA